jgi:hypothetical protein
MKRFLAVCVMLCCWTRFGVAQFQGNVKFSGRATGVVTGHSVTLSWVGSPGATSYCVYRGTAHGQYVKIASGVIGATYTDVQITHNQTLFYVATAVSGRTESGYSSEIVAAIP